MNTFDIITNEKDEVLDITDKINEILKKSKESNGTIVLNVLHTTCALTTADLDPGTDKDILEALRKMLPKISYRHPHDPGHADDHIPSAILGPSISLIFENSQLKLGEWQRVILVELNGPKIRQISYKMLS